MTLVCAVHPHVEAMARCVRCGIHLCEGCRTLDGIRNFCSSCMSQLRAPPPATPSAAVVLPLAAAARSPRCPWLAAVLSVIPGLGQAYAGHVGRGALFFGGAIALRDAAWMTPLLAAYLHVFNLFDAYRCAQGRSAGSAGSAASGKSGGRIDDVLFLVTGLAAIAMALIASGGFAAAPRNVVLPLAGMAAALVFAHETRR